MDNRRKFLGMAAATATAATLAPLGAAHAASNGQLVRESNAALATLVSQNASAKALSRSAKAILIFPKIVKAGFVVGGAGGKGILKKGGKVDGYYQSVAGSFGFQAGVQSYGYVLFLMTQSAVDYLYESKGWEIGAGPSVVLVDEGVAASLSTSTLKDDAYAFVFGQQGLMAGVSIQGSKISKIKG